MVAKLHQLEEKVEGLTDYIESKVADPEFIDELNNRLDETGILDAVRSEHGDGDVTYKGLDPDNDYIDVAQDIITRLNDRYRSIPVEEFNDTETGFYSHGYSIEVLYERLLARIEAGTTQLVFE